MKNLRKLLAIVLAVCLLLSISSVAFAADSEDILPRRPICPQCRNGYIYSSSETTAWETNGEYDCEHGKMGYDEEQSRSVTTTTWCDMECGYGGDKTTTQNRLICRGY